jgi:hypothetical protein
LKNRQAAKTAGYLVGVWIADDQHLQVIWQYHSSVLTLVGTRLQNLHRLLFLLFLLFFHKLPHEWILLPTLEKLHNKHHFLLLLFPEKAFEKSRRRKPALLQQRESARSLPPPNDGARETRNKQTRSLARSLSLVREPFDGACRRRHFSPAALQPYNPQLRRQVSL